MTRRAAQAEQTDARGRRPRGTSARNVELRYERPATSLRSGKVREHGVQLDLLDLPAPPNPKATGQSAPAAARDDANARGAVFTRPEVVEFILDLVGYTADRPLHTLRVLEPSFGHGEFLIAITRRLLQTWTAFGRKESACNALGDAVRAVELHPSSCERTASELRREFRSFGLDAKTADTLVQRWLVTGDFLLEPFSAGFDFVVGNPPYVRQELIPAAALARYRSLYATLYDRADLYVPFIERALTLLAPGGTLGFICADRWMKNRYGGPLRQFVASGFHLRFVVDMADTPAFQSEVAAYPAITVISREQPGCTRVAACPTIDRARLASLAARLRDPRSQTDGQDVRELPHVAHGSAPWLLSAPDRTAVLRRIEHDFPTLGDAGCMVGIGVATGADKVFIGLYDELDVEPSRKLPLATTKDIETGEVRWRGLGVVNPFDEDGTLVDLGRYPRLRSYFEANQAALMRRHCATKTPANWYRTIDRISPALLAKPKLLVPDIKGDAHVVFEPGRLYPHHNLYHITASDWNLRALQAVLLSSLTRLFIASYSTAMRGGFLRFQAQYLRRLRIPYWDSVPGDLRAELAEAAIRRDRSACDKAVCRLYALNRTERTAIGVNGG